MGVTAAFLADYATVRDGLLFVTAGGITRLWRADYPAPMSVALVVVIEAHRMERDRPHELLIDILGEDGASVAQVQAGYQIPTVPDIGIHESQSMPLALDLRPVGLPAPGWYSIEISIDSRHERTLQFRVGPRPDNPASQLPPQG